MATKLPKIAEQCLKASQDVLTFMKAVRATGGSSEALDAQERAEQIERELYAKLDMTAAQWDEFDRRARYINSKMDLYA